MEKPNIQEPDVVLYHADCLDGFTAAWAVWERYPEARYYAVKYNQRLDDLDLTDQHVLVVDFSFKRDYLWELVNQSASMVILDHHKTAKDELAGFPGLDATDVRVRCHFDMEKSGARLAYEYINGPYVKVPWLVQLVEDRDLWKFDYVDTKPVCLLLGSMDYNFTQWSMVNNTLEGLRGPAEYSALLKKARLIQLYHDQCVADIASSFFMSAVGSALVPTVYAPKRFVSDVCHLLLDKTDAPFVRAICVTGDRVEIAYAARPIPSMRLRAPMGVVAMKMQPAGLPCVYNVNMQLDDKRTLNAAHQYIRHDLDPKGLQIPLYTA